MSNFRKNTVKNTAKAGNFPGNTLFLNKSYQLRHEYCTVLIPGPARESRAVTFCNFSKNSLKTVLNVIFPDCYTFFLTFFVKVREWVRYIIFDSYKMNYNVNEGWAKNIVYILGFPITSDIVFSDWHSFGAIF